jgi:predicted RNA-binding protein with PUA-like domain
MNYWIFQGNPDYFEINEYLAENKEIVWSVRQKHLSEYMQPGDEVFLWRAAGKKKAVAGIVVVAHLTSKPRMMPDHLVAHPYWKEDDPSKVELRVELKIEKRCLGARETIKRNWIATDPELQGLRILKMRNETNYKISAPEAKRLAMLCRTVGSDWSREEDVAALWAYNETEGGSVSKTDGSPVAVVASLIGRPIGGVYNKVMNFRHIDPRDTRKGLSSVSEMDREIWADFYNHLSKQLDMEKLDNEFRLIWKQKPNPTTLATEYTDFGEAPDDDPAQLASFAAKVRKGQPKFRENLRKLYKDRCAISGWGPPQVLEAAHIYGHSESGLNHSSNGLLLRADIHLLMDAGLLRIDPKTQEIIVSDDLRETEYWEFNGRRLRPRVDGSQPSSEYLQLRFNEGDKQWRDCYTKSSLTRR